jgi:hypothetical protein
MVFDATGARLSRVPFTGCVRGVLAAAVDL